ncbi:LysR substrate-binding domain-containing protein [Pseudomonas indica]|uniref:LysR substrate-binding domain-containing protein n=1 Tax=Pseudomonas indica TaxID=137658 RepID=UPI000BABB121|nr:LysR substrate-binding domain-containing protein [Pseudomonas indica]MBU3057420.1 LysR family transcriptional regulator [Pseudomonas indica]PAU57547.1 LysR family transcriptional regulator [Pseudomonas indica]
MVDKSSARIPPLYALRAFEMAARFGSFTLAAEQLCITQSAVSRHVRSLEQSLGCRLFERKGSKLVLTEHARILAQGLQMGFETIENACMAVASREVSLRLKAPSTLTMRWLLGALEGFHARHPGIQVQLTSVWMDEDFVDFRAEPFDCAILLGTCDSMVDESEKLFDEWLVPVCAPELLGSEPWTLDRLANCELIHPTRDRRDWRRWLERMGCNDRLAWRKGKLFDTLELAISAAMKGHGLSMGDLSLVKEELDSGALVLPFRTAVRSQGSYYLVWPTRSRQNRTLELLRAHLLECLPTFDAADMTLLE